MLLYFNKLLVRYREVDESRICTVHSFKTFVDQVKFQEQISLPAYARGSILRYELGGFGVCESLAVQDHAMYSGALQ